MVMTKILMALSSNNHFHSAWESTAEKDRTLDNLRTRLMIEEKRMQSQESSEVSGALLAKGKNKKIFHHKSDKKPGKCFICIKVSHWKKDCPLRQKNASKALLSECLITNSDDKDPWYLDSGATEHMSKHREWFSSYTQLKCIQCELATVH